MINILLVEKNLILSNTLTNLLTQDKELNVIGVCRHGNKVVEFLNKHSVDIILIDPNQTNGFVITVQITKEFPNIKIIGYSTNGESSKKRMLEFGASSYLSKYDTNLNDLKNEIKKYHIVGT
jgi:DNA-binding NarL/FixJ family response regulator